MSHADAHDALGARDVRRSVQPVSRLVYATAQLRHGLLPHKLRGPYSATMSPQVRELVERAAGELALPRRQRSAAKELAHLFENEARAEFGFRPVGEGWVSETLLFAIVTRLLPGEEIARHVRPAWLQGPRARHLRAAPSSRYRISGAAALHRARWAQERSSVRRMEPNSSRLTTRSLSLRRTSRCGSRLPYPHCGHRDVSTSAPDTVADSCSQHRFDPHLIPRR
jgi:hypothetical protein